MAIIVFIFADPVASSPCCLMWMSLPYKPPLAPFPSIFVLLAYPLFVSFSRCVPFTFPPHPSLLFLLAAPTCSISLPCPPL